MTTHVLLRTFMPWLTPYSADELSDLDFIARTGKDRSNFEVADTIPAPPPDVEPESAPPVDAPPEGEDEWLVWGRQ